MRSLVFALLLVSGPALADQKPTKPPTAANTKPKTKAKAPPCKMKKVGKKMKCIQVYEAEIDVRAGAPKPDVVIVPTDGRKVTGRPKSEDRLQGLGPHTR
jgi:hypothetical protein